MFSLSKLVLGQVINNEFLSGLIDNQSYTRVGTQIVGEIIHWSNSEEVTDVAHMIAAPDGTVVYAREHYYGDVTFVKNNGQWSVTSIQSR